MAAGTQQSARSTRREDGGCRSASTAIFEAGHQAVPGSSYCPRDDISSSGDRVNAKQSRAFPFLRIIALCMVVCLAACATRPSPNFRGRWQPVNTMAEAPVVIPLYESFVYQAGPMDRTLKGLLTRWAKGSKRTLSYLNSNDFTLYGPVENINTPSVQQAVAQLNAAYGSYGVAISVDDRQITVRNEAGQPTSVVEPQAQE